MKSSTQTLIKTLEILAQEIQSDGVANAAIAEAAGRLEEQEVRINQFIESISKLGNQVVDLLNERDQAWAELRKIRDAIGANSEESALDEVRRFAAILRRESAELGAQVEAHKQKEFELTCFRIDVLRCLKTIAFEHNHQDIIRYKNLALSVMKSIENNESMLDMQADAGRAGFIEGCAYAGDGFVSIPDAQAADQYAEKVKAGEL